MFIKVISYYLIAALSLLAQLQYSLLTKIGISERLSAILFFGIYLAMLFFDIKSSINKSYEYKQVKKRAFIFSFCLGLFWGIALPVGEGFTLIKSLENIALFIFGLAVFAAIWGLIGIFISNIIYSYSSNKIFKKNIPE